MEPSVHVLPSHTPSVEGQPPALLPNEDEEERPESPWSSFSKYIDSLYDGYDEDNRMPMCALLCYFCGPSQGSIKREWEIDTEHIEITCMNCGRVMCQVACCRGGGRGVMQGKIIQYTIYYTSRQWHFGMLQVPTPSVGGQPPTSTIEGEE